MTPDQAADLAARTLAVLDDGYGGLHDGRVPRCLGCERVAADRERVASDLAGLRDHFPVEEQDAYTGYSGWRCRCGHHHEVCPDAARYADGLRRTAALYGVTP